MDLHHAHNAALSTEYSRQKWYIWRVIFRSSYTWLRRYHFASSNYLTRPWRIISGLLMYMPGGYD